MRKRKKKSKINQVIILLLIIVLFLIFLGVQKTKNNSSETSNQESTDKVSKNDENVQNTESENSEVENVNSEPVKDLNNLSDTEASFGEIDKPLYKKGEKELNLPIIIYHEFETPVPEDDIYKLYSTEARFEENVSTLLEAGYTFITLDDLYKYNQGKIGLPEKNVTITIDDGAIGCYTEAFNVVKKYKVPMTIFIVENLVGTDHYFSWEAAKEMYDTGLVKIHVHGQQHINATDYSTSEQLIAAYNHTHELIEEKLGNDNITKIMAYPAGKSSSQTISALKSAGFEIQVQTRYGTVNKSSTLDLTNLGRVRGEQASGSSLLSVFGN